MNELHSSVNRKFIETLSVDEWEVETDTGWEDITHVNKTIKYDVWEIKTSNNTVVKGADTHIFIDASGNEVFLKDSLGLELKTQYGSERVVSVTPVGNKTYMYDLTVNSAAHTYYTNGILSHNTTVAAGYLLWYAMFIPDSTILIASNQWNGAQEIMHRVRYAYESIPNHIRAGVTAYNKRSISFDNNSRIVGTATTETTGRGMSLSLVYLDEFAFVPVNVAKEFWTSLSPTLATGGKCIITSTPNTDEDQFADIWFNANRTLDDAGNEKEIGKNGFRAYMATWESHPDRDQEWADSEKSAIGEERFFREHLCVASNANITLCDMNGEIIVATMQDYYNMCSKAL